MTEPRTGAERYFAERMTDPAYAAGYHEARARIDAVDAAAAIRADLERVYDKVKAAHRARTPAVIFDRDGTLASVDWCRPAARDDASWARFNAALPFDAVVPYVAALLHSIRPGVTRIMTTGRMDNLRPQLSDWLTKHDLPIDLLLMRAYGDTRKDSIVKQEIYDTQIAPFYDVVLVVDDRPQVCDMWRANGLNLIQVVDPIITPTILTQGGNA